MHIAFKKRGGIPDSFIKIYEKGRVDDLPVRKTEEPLSKNLIGIGPLCDLGWKLTFEANTCKITREGEEIIVQRVGNLYGVNIADLSRKSTTANIAMRIYSVSPDDQAELWHNRLMHRSLLSIIDWSKEGLLPGVKPLSIKQHSVCPDCAATKSTRSSHKRSKKDHSDGSRDSTVTVDTFGPLATECCAEYSGCRYIQTFLNIGSRTPSSAMMKQKSEALDVLKEYAAREFFTHYHSDGAPELISDNTYSFLNSKNISYSHTNPYTPEQNAHVERIQGTLDGMSSAALHKAGLGDTWKCHAWACAIQTLKFIPTNTDRGLMSPFEYKNGHKGDVSHLRTFGCRAWVHIPEAKRSKGESLKSHEGMFVGYGDGEPGWKVYLFHSKETVTSSDVIFDETSFPGHHAMTSVDALVEEKTAIDPVEFNHLIGRKYYDPDERDYFVTTGIRTLNGYIVADRRRVRTSRASKRSRRKQEAPIFVRDVEQMLRTAMKLNSSTSSAILGQDNHSASEDSDHGTLRRELSSEQAGGPSRGPRRRRESSPLTFYPESTSRGRVDDLHNDEHSLYARVDIDEADDFIPPPLVDDASDDDDDSVPQTIQQALKSSDAVHWRVAIKEEVDYINSNAWTPIQGAPTKKPLRTRLVFKKKIKNGKYKYKVRLVACGYDQMEGVDYYDSYAPTSRPSSLRLFCYLVLINQMGVPRHIDVVKAYLNADIDEDTFCCPPSDPDSVFFKGQPVFKLRKALYGLKQSAYLWNQMITKYLVEEAGFRKHRMEPCLFSRRDRIDEGDYLETNVLVYVDDLIVASQSQELRDRIVEMISEKFNTTDEGDLSEYLGVSIRFDYKDNRRKCFLDQTKYIERKLKEFGMSNCRGAVTPLTRGVRFSNQEPLGRIDFPYRQILGSLIHAMNWTRPDLAYSINMLSRYAANPTLRATSEIIRVLRYLQLTKHLQLTYDVDPDPQADIHNFRLVAYSDSDYAGCLDTGRSVTSYLTFMGPALLMWRSRRQTIVAQSSCEAEYAAINEAYGSIIELEHVIRDDYHMTFYDTPIIYADNQASIGIVVNQAALDRSRQFRVIHHRLHDAIERRDLMIVKIDSSRNHADIGTKSLDGPDHHRHVSGLGLTSPYDSDSDSN